jgi:type I restriction enzyme S subunit
VGNIIALRGLNIKNGKLVLDDVKYIDDSNFSKLNRSKLYIDDIMFTYVGTVGEVAIIKENDKFYLAPNVSRIRIQSDYSPKYISHYMRRESFYKQVIFPLIATSSQPALSMENIRKFDICLPQNREEQDRLAEYFDTLDHLITLHQRKLEELQYIKKFMLQNMFV